MKRTKKEPICCCADPGCPHCKGHCENRSVTVVVRIDMEDITGTPVCQKCAEDCMDSGLFRLEPWQMRHHRI